MCLVCLYFYHGIIMDLESVNKYCNFRYIITVTIRRFVLYLHVGIHFFARTLQTNYCYVNLIYSVQCFHFEVSFVAMFR